MNCLGNALDTPQLRGVTFEGHMCVSEHNASQMSDNFIHLFDFTDKLSATMAACRSVDNDAA